jgi:hypothetical protein
LSCAVLCCAAQAWVTGVFFCFGAMAWLIRALLLALVKSLTWIYPPANPQGGQGVGQTSHGAVQGVSAAAAGSSSYSLFGSSSSSSSNGCRNGSPLLQQLPGCARAVPPSPPRQHGNVPSADAVMRVYGTPLSYAAAATHGVVSSSSNRNGLNGNGNGAGVDEGFGGRALGVKSPGKGGQGQGGGSTPGRVRFADEI